MPRGRASYWPPVCQPVCCGCSGGAETRSIRRSTFGQVSFAKGCKLLLEAPFISWRIIQLAVLAITSPSGAGRRAL